MRDYIVEWVSRDHGGQRSPSGISHVGGTENGKPFCESEKDAITIIESNVEAFRTAIGGYPMVLVIDADPLPKAMGAFHPPQRKWLRTEANGVRYDNLGSLPERVPALGAFPAPSTLCEHTRGAFCDD